MAKHLTKQQILDKSRIDAFITASNKAHLLVTLSVLNDVFEFSPEDINDFVDCYEVLLQSYNSDKEDITNLSNHIEEICGIKIL